MRRLALLCLAGWVAAGAAACAGSGAVTPPRASPGPAAPAPATSAPAVATVYYRAVVARDYRLAFSYLASGATGPDGRTLTWPAFLQLADTMDSEDGPVVTFSVAAFQDLVVMTVQRERGGLYHAHLGTTQVAGRRAISSIDRI